MRNCVLSALGGVVALAGAAWGQSFTTGSGITFSLHWQDTGNHNGVLEPGEAALVTLDASFTNQNTVATFQPPIGTFGSGTIRGLGSGFIDLLSTNNGSGNWNADPNAGYGVAPDWDITGGQGNGQSTNGGQQLRNIQFGQFAPTPNSINTTNPIVAIWSGTWTPSSFAARSITWTVAGAVAAGQAVGSVAMRLSSSNVASIFVDPASLVYGSVSIPIIPAPSAVMAIGMGLGLGIGRRRRSRA